MAHVRDVGGLFAADHDRKQTSRVAHAAPCADTLWLIGHVTSAPSAHHRSVVSILRNHRGPFADSFSIFIRASSATAGCIRRKHRHLCPIVARHRLSMSEEVLGAAEQESAVGRLLVNPILNVVFKVNLMHVLLNDLLLQLRT